MKLPIIINEHGDVSAYRSLEDACSYMEVIDVRNNEYVAYDADGYLLNLKIATEYGISVERDALVRECLVMIAVASDD